jgi:hypothetical protein
MIRTQCLVLEIEDVYKYYKNLNRMSRFISKEHEDLNIMSRFKSKKLENLNRMSRVIQHIRNGGSEQENQSYTGGDGNFSSTTRVI